MSDYIIYNKNCIDNIDLIENNTIDSVIIDPPYCQTHTAIPSQYKQANVEFDRNLFFELITTKCKKDASFGIFGYGETLYRDVIKLIDLGWSFNHEFVWYKGIGSLPTHKIPKMHETFVALVKGKKVVKECKISDFYSNCQINIKNYKKLSERFNGLLKTLKRCSIDELKIVIDNLENGYGLPFVGKNEELNTNFLDEREVFIKNTFYKRVGTVLDISRKTNRLHPTQKPDELMFILVKMLSYEGDVVVDTFMGSGSTGVACLQNNRNFIGFEIYKDYYDVAEKRLKELSMHKKLF